jgi:hypothetical protein
LLVVATSARIVVTETIERVIPQRDEHRDEQRLGKRNPDIVHMGILLGNPAVGWEVSQVVQRINSCSSERLRRG